ncbi:MAG: histidine kinase [Gemmatimonadota bacterium]
MTTLHVRPHPVVRSLLGAPLWVKLLGANALIIVVAALAMTRYAGHTDANRHLVGFFLGALVASVAINITLVMVALRPLRALEHAAGEVWRGNTTARVPESLLADRDMARVGHTINLLVGALVQDGQRSRELAALVISQAESDQARIAHELHESAAQRLAAQVMQLSAIAGRTSEAHTSKALDELRDVTAETLEQVRLLVRGMNAVRARDAFAVRAHTGEPVEELTAERTERRELAAGR